MSNLPGESKTIITSSKHKSVFLPEWWLTKVEMESKIGVGGFVKKESLGARGMRLLGSPSTNKNINTIDDGIQVFNSAAIAKRHDSNTIEAVDGIIITISGCINKSRTLSYGFSLEVCDGFLSGFPYIWENYAPKYSHEHEKCSNTIKQSLPVSFDDLPVTRVRDLLISESGSRVLTNIIYRDILKHTEKSLDQSDSSIKKVRKIFTETDVDNQDDVSFSNLTQKMIEEYDKIDLQSGNFKESDNGGFKLDKLHKITREKQSFGSSEKYPLRSNQGLSRRYPLRSTRKRKRI